MKTIEQLSVNLFDKVFGRDLDARIEALKSEFDEFIEQYEDYKRGESILCFDKLQNELADVQSIVTHISNIIGDTFEQQIIYTNQKLLSRIEVSKYKGEHTNAIKNIITSWQLHVNKLNGDKYGIPDNVEIDKFLNNYNP